MRRARRGVSAGRLAAATGLVLAASITAAPAASAQDRFASPTGSGTACTSVNPCDIQFAVESATAGQEVQVAPGDYNLSTNPLAVPANVEVHGATGQPLPRLSATNTPATGALTLGLGSVVRRLALEHNGSYATPGQPSALANFGGTAEQLFVHTDAAATASGVGLIACAQGNVDSTLRDSVCWNNGAASGGGFNVAFFLSNSVSATRTATLRNVTTVAAPGTALSTISSGATSTAVVNGRNVIVQGAIVASTTSAAATATIDLDFSNFSATPGTSGPGTETATAPGTLSNETVPPVFVDAAAGDFHQQATSTGTINQGDSTAASLGLFDLDEEARIVGGAPDIGADEFVDADGDGVPDYADNCDAETGPASNGGCPLTPDPGGGGGGGGTPAADTTPPDTTITEGPEGKTKKKSATFSFSGTDARVVASFQCRLDDGQFETCTSPKTYSKLKKGKHTVEVRAVDAAGNVDPTPASRSWKVKKKKKKK